MSIQARKMESQDEYASWMANEPFEIFARRTQHRSLPNDTSHADIYLSQVTTNNSFMIQQTLWGKDEVRASTSDNKLENENSDLSVSVVSWREIFQNLLLLKRAILTERTYSTTNHDVLSSIEMKLMANDVTRGVGDDIFLVCVDDGVHDRKLEVR